MREQTQPFPLTAHGGETDYSLRILTVPNDIVCVRVNPHTMNVSEDEYDFQNFLNKINHSFFGVLGFKYRRWNSKMQWHDSTTRRCKFPLSGHATPSVCFYTVSPPFPTHPSLSFCCNPAGHHGPLWCNSALQRCTFLTLTHSTSVLSYSHRLLKFRLYY